MSLILLHHICCLILLVCSYMYRCEAISSSIKECEANDKIQAVILKSACPMTFCSGLDLLEMAPNPDPDRLDKFWASLQQGFLDLYGSRLATIAAIEGHGK